MKIIDVWEILKDDADINEFVSSDKIYPGLVPKGIQPPFISIYAISRSRQVFGNRAQRIQISCFDPIYGRGQALADAVETALEKLDGSLNIFAVHIESRVDLYENDSKLHHVAITGELHYNTRLIFN